jgi:TrmH RNA methyltransferase
MARAPIKPVNSKITPKAGVRPAIVPAQKPAGLKRTDEMLYYGFHACKALFAARSQDIVRAYCTEDRLQDVAMILKWCAANKKAYHVVTKQDLENLTESVHHEGIVLLAERKASLTERELFERLKTQRQPLVVLDQVINPHNIGAIMRIMAHFGWKHLVASHHGAAPLSSSAARISEGGFEHVDFTLYKDQTTFLANLKALGYLTVGTATDGKKSLYAIKFPNAAFAFFLGNEVKGLSKGLATKLDTCVSIPGSGAVQSLNVAMASGLVIGEYVRQHGLVP